MNEALTCELPHGEYGKQIHSRAVMLSLSEANGTAYELLF